MEKRNLQILLSITFLFFYNILCSQNIVDECLTSVTPVVNDEFISSPDVANVYNSDVLEWQGDGWNGGYEWNQVTIPPPSNEIGCRAIFLGASNWTYPGEAIGLRLDAPLVSGTTYTFDITYISHGALSDGNFEPSFYTNAGPSLVNATLVGSLPSVGNDWTTNSFSFEATAAQDGDVWIIFKTEIGGTTGLISSFCDSCTDVIPECSVSVNSETVCEGTSATVVATPSTTGNYEYEWSVPTDLADPGNVSSFTTDVAGDYSVTITDLDSGCTSTASGTITVNPLPDVSVNSESICEGSSATIVATPITTGIYDYQWSVPTGFQNPGNVSSFTTDVAGDYSVTVIDLDTDCTITVMGTITVNLLPDVSVNSESICEGSSATIAATPTTAGNYEYQWSVPDGFANPGNVSSFTTDVAGDYSVVITDLDTDCTSNSASGTLNVFPDFDFTVEQYCDEKDFILEIVPIDNSFSVSDANFVWELNNTIIGNDSEINLSSYLEYSQQELPLNITINITANGGCMKTRPITIEMVYCGIPQGISPNNDGLNDSFDLTLLEVKNLVIYNRYGTKVFQRMNYIDEWYGQSDNGDDLPTGTYYYVIEFKSNSAPKLGWVYLNR